MVAELQTPLPLEHRRHEPPSDREHGQGGHPCGFLPPHGGDGGRMRDPAPARFHRAMLLLIRLEQLGICALSGCIVVTRTVHPACPRRGRAGPRVHAQAIADFDLGCLSLRRTASAQPLFGGGDCFHTIVERMIAPEARRAAPPSLPPAFIVGAGRLGVGCTGKPAGFHTLDVLGDALGLFGLGGGVGDGCLMSQLAGVDAEQAEFFYSELPVSVCHFHWADDAAPVPTPWELLPGPAGFSSITATPPAAGPMSPTPAVPHRCAAPA